MSDNVILATAGDRDERAQSSATPGGPGRRASGGAVQTTGEVVLPAGEVGEPFVAAEDIADPGIWSH